jgi:hypothetical protein
LKPDYSKISEEPTAFFQSSDDFMNNRGTYYFGKLKNKPMKKLIQLTILLLTSLFPDPMRGAEQSYSNQTPWNLESGATLRDYFANSAMQGIVSNSSVFGVKTMYNDDIARLAYSIADELLKQREL